MFWACGQEELVHNAETDTKQLIAENYPRLNFADENELSSAINAKETQLKSGTNTKFVSMLDKLPTKLRSSGNDETYYTAIGFDSLVPNPNFARLFNPDGELEVAANIVKVTTSGTYVYAKSKEDRFNSLLDENENGLSGVEIDKNVEKIEDGIFLYKTFAANEDYKLVSSGNYELLPDEEDGNGGSSITRAASEPDYDSFDTFSADRHTFVGKLIQSIIGSTKDHTINFSSKRRVKGSFYFYNYGVYSEIGVQGWTDKKNWITWSKTEANELRVGWRNVVLKRKIEDHFADSFKAINSLAYFPPQYMELNGRQVNVATLIVKDFKPDLRDRIITYGAKAIFNWLKDQVGIPPTQYEKAQAFLVASRTELLYVSNTEERICYNTKSYTHVFDNNWMEVQVGWNTENGFFINGINQHNANDFKTYIKVVSNALADNGPSLESGEVHICARFGDDWRGMKIVKK